jgi:hypothetical protein
MIEPAPDHPRALLVLEAQPGEWPAVLVGAQDGVRLYTSTNGVWSMAKLWRGVPVLALFRTPRYVLAVTPQRVERIPLPH